MRFVKAVWKLLVGIKDALVLLFMLMFFGLLYAALSARPAAIGDGVLAMDLDGVLVEQASRPDAFATIAGAGSVTHEFELRDLIAAVLAHGLDVDLAHRHGGRGHHLAGGEGAHRRLDPRRGVLHRQQHVVGDGLVEALVQRAHLGGVRVRQCLFDQQDDVVVLSHGHCLPHSGPVPKS